MRIRNKGGRFWKVVGATFLGGAMILALIFAAPMIGSPGIGENNGGYGYDGCVYCTQTQGGWGQVASEGNVGELRDAYFDTVFPGGLVVGGDGHTLTFTNSMAVQLYLPAGGTAASLTQDHANPLTTESGVLGGQVTALKLNVLFSDAGIGKVLPACSLRDLEIDDGPFEGLTVGEFLTLAEEVLGGDTSGLTGGETISDVSDTATAINENFVDCIQPSNGFLDIPNS